MKTVSSLVSVPFFAFILQRRSRRLQVCVRYGIQAILACCATAVLSAQTVELNFGSVNIGTTSSASPLTFTFEASDTLATTQVLTLGATGLDFADAGSDTCTAGTTYAVGQTCTVNVTFTPQFAGSRSGAVVLQDSSGNTMATGYLVGKGTGPQIVYQPAVQSQLGSGFSEPLSVVVDGNGDLFVTNDGSSTVYEMVAINGKLPPSPTIRTIGSGFGTVLFVTMDSSGNLYVADTINGAVKEVFEVNGSVPASPTIRTLATGFTDPEGIAVDSNGDVWVANTGVSNVDEIVAVNGSIPASPLIKPFAGYKNPTGVAVDSSGNVYVADTGDGAVKEIAVSTGLTTLASGFNGPFGIALDGVGDVYVTEDLGNTVKEIVAVNGSIPASPTIVKLGIGFNEPLGVAVDASDNLYVADTLNARVEKLDYSDAPSLSFVSTVIGAVSSDSPRTVTILNAGNAALSLPVPSTGNNPSIAENFTLNSSGVSACSLLTSESAEPATLAAGQTCQLPISFAPTEAGALNGSLVLTDSNLNAAAPNYTSQTISLSGTGTGSFMISSSASSLTMNQGGSGTSTITVSSQNGFTGNVTLSASGLPSGVSASFSPNPTTGTSVLTITANSIASIGTYSVTITGTSGSLVASTTFQLTVNQGPYFTLGASPNSMTLLLGASGSSNITVTGYNGFAGSVSLSASGLPNGVGASFTPNPITGASVLTLTESTVPAAAPAAGSYNITITGTSSGLYPVSTTLVLTVPPTAFTLVSTIGSTAIEQGASLTDTIGMNPLNGFSGSVNLTVSGLTSGLTASISPNPITGTSILTVTASGSAPPGNTLLTITGTYPGYQTAITTIEIGVFSAPPDYSLVVNPPGLVVVQGATGTSTISIIGQAGFSGLVNLQVNGLPSGVTATLSPNPTSNSSVLTLSAASTVAPGLYEVVIAGNQGSGTLAVSTTFNLTVSPPPGFAPAGANFGTANINTTSPVQTLRYTFGSSVSLGSIAVLTQGASGLDFADTRTGTCETNGLPYSYAAGASCTVNVDFTPTAAGIRNGAVELEDNSGNPIATAYLQGVGLGPQINFLPNTESVVANAAGGLLSPYAVAVDGSGNIYIDDVAASAVFKETFSSGTYTQSIIPTSSLNSPTGVAVDGAGNIYISDTGNSRVLKETPFEGAYNESVVADSTNNGILSPVSLAVDGNGNVYFFATNDQNYQEYVFEETPSANGYLQGTVPYSGVSWTGDLAVDGSGNVYIVDTGNSQVIEETLTAGGYVQSTVPTNGLNQPSGIAVDGMGNIYVADIGGGPVFKETLTAGSYVQSTIMTSPLNEPLAVAVDQAGNVYIGDAGTQEILKEDFADAPSLTFASTTFGTTSADSPQTVTVENIGNAPLTFPIPSSGNDPGITANFTLNSSGASACPLINSSSSAAGTLAAGASCQLPISFTPTTAGTLSGSLVLTDSNLNAAAPGYASQSISLNGVGTQVTPVITWAMPAAITYGTPLSSIQLNASSTVAGSFTYSPVTGSVPGAGQQTLTVTFTPADTTDYTTTTATVTLTVNQAAPSVTWATPAAITYGTPLSSTQLDASSTVAGSFSYSPAAGTVLAAGQQTLAVTFTPTDNTDYTSATRQVNLTVNKATLSISWPTPAAIPYGTALSATQLDASSTAAGTFSYSPAVGTVLAVGSHTLSVTFTAATPSNYTTRTATATVNLTVNKATPTITWSEPAAITYGTALSSKQLDATASVAGNFAYSPASGTVLNAGVQVLTTTFTPTNKTDYTTATASVTLTVNKATPTITWATPAPITYGSPLSSTQLDARANVGGTWVYSPAAGTVLTAGAQTLSVTFTPTNTTDYTTNTASVNLTVNKATPTINIKNIPTNAVEGGSFTPTFSYSGNGSPAESVASSTTKVCIVSSGMVNFVGAGKCTLTASATATSDYTAATGNAQSFTVKP